MITMTDINQIGTIVQEEFTIDQLSNFESDVWHDLIKKFLIRAHIKMQDPDYANFITLLKEHKEKEVIEMALRYLDKNDFENISAEIRENIDKSVDDTLKHL